MNREIKFRTWHKVKKIMYWWNPMWGEAGNDKEITSMVEFGKELISKGLFNVDGETVKCDDCEIMQAVGMRDKNEKKMYEGDIVRFSTEGVLDVEHPEEQINAFGYGPIVYDANTCTFRIDAGFNIIEKREDDTATESTAGHNMFAEAGEAAITFEVVGNIHENPEVMEAAE